MCRYRNYQIFYGAASKEPSLCTKDSDGDGWGDSQTHLGETGSDCNDLDPLLNQDNADFDNQSTCDGDCDDNDGWTFIGAASVEGIGICMRDYDNDGYGDESPNFGVTAGTDCNDSDPNFLPVDFDGDGYHFAVVIVMKIINLLLVKI